MLKSLQAGRAVAAIAVVMFHMHGSPLLPHGSWLAEHSVHGNLGVDFFFVLSGFIILFAHQRDIGHPKALRRYASNRVRRIYPTYWLYTAVFVAMVVVMGGSTVLPKAGDWFSSISLIRLSTTVPPLSVAWTLFYEIAFYLLFGVLIVNRTAGIVVMFVWLALIALVHRFTPTNSISGVWTSAICLNFFVGMAACRIYVSLSLPQAFAAIGLGVFGLCITVVLMDRCASWIPEVLTGVSSGAIICGLAGVETKRALSFGPLGMIGDASFTLYLLHEHVTQSILKALLHFHLLNTIPPDALFVAILALTLVVCVLLYHSVEKPLVSWLRRAGRKGVPKPSVQLPV